MTHILTSLIFLVLGAIGQGAVLSQGISNHDINAFTEDAQGHIWIGTFRGLNKYDLHTYHQYFATSDSLSLPDNQVTSLHSDREGRLWVGTVAGAALYTPQGNFRRIPVPSGTSSNISAVLEGPRGEIIFIHGTSISVYEEQLGTMRVAVNSYQGPGEMGFGYHLDPRGRLWIVTSSRIRCFDTMASFALTVDTPTEIAAFHSCLLGNGQLWMSGMSRISIFDTLSEKFIPLPAPVRDNARLNQADVTNIFQVDINHVILTTYRHGVFVYDRQRGTVISDKEDGFPYDIPSFTISLIFKDSSGNIWFGSDDRGFFVNYRYKDQFNSNRYLSSFFKGKTVLSLSSSQEGNIWISTKDEGLFVYEPSAGKITWTDMAPLYGREIPGELVADRVMVDSRGKVWICSSQHSCVLRCTYRGGTLSSERIYFVPYPMCIAEDETGGIWIGGASKDVYHLSAGDAVSSSGEFTPVTAFQDGYIFVSDIEPLSGGKVLCAAFMSPLMTVDVRTGEVAALDIDEDCYRECITRSVLIPTAIKRDSRGDIWVGTVANGLLRYDCTTGRLSPLPDAPCSDIEGIEEDCWGNIWISSLDGLGKYDRTVGKITTYRTEDGLGGNEFHDKASCALEDGTLIFGGMHGVTVFNPIDAPSRRSVPLIFENLRVYNDLVFPSQDGPIDRILPLQPDIKLKRRQNTFSISFSALDYCESERTRYSYKLEDYDTYWRDAGTDNTAFYGNVPPGKYRLRVRISNNNNSIVEKEEGINVRVLPLIWETPLMKCLYVLLLLGLAIWAWRYYDGKRKSREAIRMAEAEKEQLRATNQMNVALFSNLAHEFRTPLTMISGPVTELSEKEDIPASDRMLLDIVRRSVARMLRLVNQIMDLGRLENESLKLKVRKGDITRTISKYMEIFQYNADNRGIELTSTGLEEPFMMYFDEDKLEKILANLLSNAMKYTPTGGKVTVAFDLDRDNPSMAKVTVSDTGAGIPEDKLEKIFDRYYQLSNQTRGTYSYSTGIGLYYSRSLADLHHGSLKASNATEGTGAVFTLLLPIAEGAYTEEERKPLEENVGPVESVPALRSDRPAAADNDTRPTVMAIDDDSEVLQYLRALLDTSYNVVSCFDAQTALRKIHEQAPDIVLSDVIMPGMSGYDLCRSIKSDMLISHIPVVLITAKGSVREQVEGLDAGADAYVTKPFDPSYLKALLKSQLDNRAKVKALLADATKTEEISPSDLSAQDVAFMQKLYDLMEKELGNPELDISRMTEMMGMSRTKFYYKVKGLTGENPSAFFKNYKLNRAAQLLRKGEGNMSEIADMTGFSTLSHFSTSFKKKFGVPPSEYKG